MWISAIMCSMDYSMTSCIPLIYTTCITPFMILPDSGNNSRVLDFFSLLLTFSMLSLQYSTASLPYWKENFTFLRPEQNSFKALFTSQFQPQLVEAFSWICSSVQAGSKNCFIFLLNSWLKVDLSEKETLVLGLVALARKNSWISPMCLARSLAPSMLLMSSSMWSLLSSPEALLARPRKKATRSLNSAQLILTQTSTVSSFVSMPSSRCSSTPFTRSKKGLSSSIPMPTIGSIIYQTIWCIPSFISATPDSIGSNISFTLFALSASQHLLLMNTPMSSLDQSATDSKPASASWILAQES